MRFALQKEKDTHIMQFHADAGSREILERIAAEATK